MKTKIAKCRDASKDATRKIAIKCKTIRYLSSRESCQCNEAFINKNLKQHMCIYGHSLYDKRSQLDSSIYIHRGMNTSKTTRINSHSKDTYWGMADNTTALFSLPLIFFGLWGFWAIKPTQYMCVEWENRHTFIIKRYTPEALLQLAWARLGTWGKRLLSMTRGRNRSAQQNSPTQWGCRLCHLVPICG